MSKKLLITTLCIIFFFGLVQNSFAQETEEQGSFIIEGEIETEFKTELQEEEPKPQFITSDVLSPKDVEPAINFYIRSDINRKFSGLVTNLKLEKIYGVLQEDKIASVYFDYSYTSVRNRDVVLTEKGKMTFLKFNSGRWFNAELSIFLMDSYPFAVQKELLRKGE
jgi:hypothetical protein